MAIVFEQTGRSVLARLQALLRDAFQIKKPEDAPSLLEESLLEWKYWQSRQDWDGGRSYTLSSNGALLAHAAVLPMAFQGPGISFSALHFIDWAASATSISGGANLLRRLTALADVTLAIGGSQATRQLLPLLHFQPAGRVLTMARPIRPWVQIRTHQCRDWRLPLRLARNLSWNRPAPMETPAGWSFQRAEPQAVPPDIWTAAGEGGSFWRRRSPETLVYFLSCPRVRFEFYLACENRVPCGGFLLATVNRVTRIADLWVKEPCEERYESVYRLAMAAAYQAREVVELVVYSSLTGRAAALKRCGFRILREDDLMALIRIELPVLEFDCQMLDNDSAFLYGRSPCYLT